METNENQRSTPIRVLMLGPSRQAKGGIASVVNQYFDAGIAEKVKLEYISTTIDGNKCKKLLSAVEGYIHFLIKGKNFDVIHVHMASRNSYRRKKLFIDLASYLGKKIIIHLHGAEFELFYNQECSEKKRKEITKVFEKASRVIVLSEEWKQKVNRLFHNMFDDKIVILHNAITIPDFQRTNFSDCNIVFLGRLEPRKGISDLLRCMSVIFKEVPAAHLFVCGDGKQEPYMDYCIQNGLCENVTFLGWIEGNEKQEIMKESGIFVLPSYNEGLPMSMLEAMAYQMAVVCTDVGGIPSVIRDCENGRLIKPGNTEMLQESLLDLLHNPDRKRSYSINGYETVKANHNIKQNIAFIVEIYKEIVQEV